MKKEYRLIVYAIIFASFTFVLDWMFAIDRTFGEPVRVQIRDIPVMIRSWPMQRIMVRSVTTACFVLLGVLAARMMVRQRRVEAELRDSREQLRSLAEYLQETQERERTRIAREVHDQLGQVLTALKMDLSWLGKRLPAGHGVLVERAKAMSGLVDSAVQTVQSLCAQLRPGVLDDFGLPAAIEWQTTEFRKHADVEVEVRLDESAEADKDLATAVFRIYQETLTNIARHSGAAHLSVTLERTPDQLVLTVRDDGKGIPRDALNNSRSFGLMGMRERAHGFGGQLDISGSPGRGTTVVARFPFDENESRRRPPREEANRPGPLSRPQLMGATK